MSNILITGATGLIGSHMIPLLKGNTIYSISRKSTFEDKSEVKFLQIDLSKDWLESSLPDNVDTIIQLSQSEHFREFPEKAEDIFRVNVMTTLKLLEFARKTKAKSYIYASSAGIYGVTDRETSEDTEIKIKKDLGYYLGTKLCSEILVENYAQFFNIVILRPFFVYGPGQRESMLIPRLVNNIKTKKPVLLSGKEGITITPTYVTDAAHAIAAATKLKGFHKINIAGPERLSLKKISQIIGSKLKIDPVFSFQSDSESKDLIGNADKMSRFLHKPVVAFEKGISNYLQSLNV